MYTLRVAFELTPNNSAGVDAAGIDFQVAQFAIGTHQDVPLLFFQDLCVLSKDGGLRVADAKGQAAVIRLEIPLNIPLSKTCDVMAFVELLWPTKPKTFAALTFSFWPLTDTLNGQTGGSHGQRGVRGWGKRLISPFRLVSQPPMRNRRSKYSSLRKRHRGFNLVAILTHML